MKPQALLIKIAALLAANALGFLSAHICYFIGVSMGRLRITDPDFNPAIVEALFHGIYLTWILCAVFSLGCLFFRGKIALAFLLAPVLFPMIYGLRVLFMLS